MKDQPALLPDTDPNPIPPAGEKAVFDVELNAPADQITWLKDNKPLEDRLADRVRKSEPFPNHHRLEIYNCTEGDSGLYTARANNGAETATCTAQLIVQKSELLRNVL